MLKQVILLSLWIIAFNGHSQYNHEQIDINNINARVYSNSTLFTQSEYNGSSVNVTSGFEVPKGNNTHGIYSANIWMGGYTQDNALRTAADTYMQYIPNQVKLDFNYGPVASNYDSIYDELYNRVWKVTKDEISIHQNNFDNIGYEMPEVILNWPAHGNVSNGEANKLAPFVDVNSNQLYDPENGDYPEIRGDMTIFSIISDAAYRNVNSDSDSMGVEIHRMVYGYSKSGHIGNTLFVNYKIINRSSTNYHDFYFAQWVDFDLGNAFDDYIGSNPSKNLFYTYNGDSIDENSQNGQIGYGETPPAFGCTFLNHDMHAYVYYIYGGATGHPYRGDHFYKYMQARWLDSTHVVAGGNGHVSSGNFENTNFMFNGNPVTQEGWTEASVGKQPSDRRGMGSVGPFVLNNGDTINIDLAVNYAASGVSNLASVTTLFESADSIKAFYNNQSFADFTNVTELKSEINLTLYPNPAYEELTIVNRTSIAIGTIKIFDVTGKLVLEQKSNSAKHQLSISNFSSGIYMVHVLNDNNQQHIEKLIVQ